VAKHIASLNIDSRLEKGDLDLVDDIALIDYGNGKTRKEFSFASKYCSHHKPMDYPIYDSFVDKLLVYFRDKDNFFNFENDDLKNYIKFKEVLIGFQKFYGLEKYSIKEIDKYLWQFGKKAFPKSMKKERKG
jgi:hypothetical protein